MNVKGKESRERREERERERERESTERENARVRIFLPVFCKTESDERRERETIDTSDVSSNDQAIRTYRYLRT